jgi:membrane protease YdiL (CAAX protease family)
MKKIVGYVAGFLKKDCNYIYLILLMLMTGILTVINFFYVSENDFIKGDHSSSMRLVKYIIMYFTVFGGAYALQALVERKDRRFRNPKLWLLILFSVLMFSLRAWSRFPESIGRNVPVNYITLVQKLYINAFGLFSLCLPAFIYWWFVDRGKERYYGFTMKGVTLWPYFVLILLMVPLLLWAGTQPDFQMMYPRGNKLYLQQGQPYFWSGTIIYELFYSLDYVVTEFFFRGFLIIAFARYVGIKSVLPMCAFYVSIHFDKPLAEAISSFFGGFLLGVIAYRSRSIYGGIIVHLGIALLMEIIGWMHVP